MESWRSKEIEAQRAIQNRGFAVHDANVVFRKNCPNVDLIVFAKIDAFYVQVKSSQNPAGSNSVIIDGSPWTQDQLDGKAPIFNKHEHYKARFIIIVDKPKTGKTEFYIAPPEELEKLVRERAYEFAERPKRDGTRRSIRFRKELPREVLLPWRNAWHLLGDGSHILATEAD
jgi:hypothetical protein